jgi:hypothetical protein
MGIDIRKKWKPGATLEVLFSDGSLGVRAKVEHYAQTWTQYANIKFEFYGQLPESVKADIRIGFSLGKGDGTGS